MGEVLKSRPTWAKLQNPAFSSGQVAGLLDALLYRTTKRWKGKAHIWGSDRIGDVFSDPLNQCLVW